MFFIELRIKILSLSLDLIIYINNCCYSQSFILDYSDMVLTHHTTSSSLDCLSMIVESIDPTKLVNSSNSTILNQCC
jgi:hypothetical protein